jgi:thioredoxin reductase (NADPH)
VEVRIFNEVKAIHGGERLERVTMPRTPRPSWKKTLPFDAVVPQLGFHTDLGPIKQWGLDTEKAKIKVDRVMATNVPGIYAAGDIATYDGQAQADRHRGGEACTG